MRVTHEAEDSVRSTAPAEEIAIGGLLHGPGMADSPERRILVVAPQPFYQDRGTPIALRQVLEALSELDYRVDLLTFPVGEDIELPGLRLFRTANPLRIAEVPIGLSLRKLLLDLLLISALRARLRQESYCCIHAIEEAAFPAVVLARRYGVPVLYDMQSSLPEQLLQSPVFRLPPVQRFLQVMERWLLNRADLVMASVGLADRVRRLAPGATVREWRFPSALPAASAAEARALRHRLGLAPEAAVVLYSGTFEAYQGLSELIAAIPLVRAEVPRATFVLVGAQPANGLASKESTRGLLQAGALRIIERQPRSEIGAFLRMADVLVSPRAYGGNLPLKVFDYLAAGRPIVATDIPTHRTVLTEERAVLVAPETEALAGGILRLLRDGGEADRLGRAAMGYAREHLGWHAFVRAVSEIYGEAHHHAALVRR
jgi:glycosyltransferase involved in cell wall biosynthesis